MRRVALAAAWSEATNKWVAAFLESHGIEVVSQVAMGVVSNNEVGRLHPQTAFEHGKKADRKEADAVFLACGNWWTAAIVEDLERAVGKPVLTTNNMTVWHALKKIGVNEGRAGYGRLLRRHAGASRGAGRRKGRLSMKLFLALVLASSAAFAQDKTLRIQVPFAPGGGTDILTRIIAPKLSERLAQPVIVENRPGAGGALAARYTAAAAPDGQTIMMGTISEIAINPNVNPKIGYDIWKDFALIGSVAYTPMTVVVHPSVPAKNVKELIALAQAKPKALNYGSAGTGSGAHMGAELFRHLTHADITHVPYKGVGPAVADTVAGQVHMTFTTVPSVVSFVKSGQLRSLGVASAQRAPQLPDVPTFIEAGVPEYLMDYWYCLVAPAGTPKDIQARLNGAVRDVMKLPEVAAGLDKTGLIPLTMSAEEFAAYVKKENERWAAVVKAAGIKPE